MTSSFSEDIEEQCSSIDDGQCAGNPCCGWSGDSHFPAFGDFWAMVMVDGVDGFDDLDLLEARGKVVCFPGQH